MESDGPRERESGTSEGGGRPPGEPPPLGQRFYDSPFLLLALGILVMGVCFTAWGLWEILSLGPAPLP